MNPELRQEFIDSLILSPEKFEELAQMAKKLAEAFTRNPGSIMPHLSPPAWNRATPPALTQTPA